MKVLVFVLALLSGCYIDSKWDNVPGATVTPVADQAHQDAWAATVQLSVDTWAAELRAYDCPAPFVMGEGGYPVRFYFDDTQNVGVQWGEGIDGPGPSIEVRSRYDSNPTIVLHELGHALGLGHADAAHGPSIMLPKGNFNSTVYPRDVAAAACELGCGPCEGPDPYDD